MHPNLIYRTIVASAAALLCQAAAAAPAPQQLPFSFDAAPGHLPKNVVPIDYTVAIVPDASKRSLRGKESVKLLFREASSSIKFNAINMQFQQVRLDGKPVKSTVIDPKRQIVTVTLSKPAAAGEHTLTLDYTAKIETGPRGLFAQPFKKPDGSKDLLLSTQFEATDARRMFPCWDEPAFRSTFQLSTTTPAKWVSISNMPVAQRTVHGSSATTTFQRSPKMPSYLVELTSGDMASIGTKAGATDINVWAVRGQEQYGAVALNNARQILLDYNDYFDHPYPLPKLDLIAVPGGFQGAMENWGAITYNDQTLLVTPSSTIDNRQTVFSIEAHEMAHQWFGDLVTMGWWDDIWLNESFASWFAAKEIDLRNPGWHVREQEDASKEAAMGVDARVDSKPVHNPVIDELAPENGADNLIIYNKGQAVLRMLEAYIGPDTFRSGIRAYMKDRAYSNATSADLWNALSKASGSDIGALAHSWINQPGFPIVSVNASCDAAGARTIKLSQQRFLMQGSDTAQPHWSIPLRLRIGAGGQPQSLLLTEDGQTVAAGRCDEALSLNAGADGFYRTTYDATTLATNTRQFHSLPAGDRIALLDDQWAQVENGTQPLASYLALAGAMGNELNERAWNQVIDVLSTIERIERNTSGHAAFVAYASGLLKPVATRLGWQAASDETAGVQRLRRTVLSRLGAWGDQEVVAEARKRFATFVADRNSIAPDDQAMILTIVAQNADAATFEQLHAIAKAAANETEMRRYYALLMRVRDPQLAARAAAIALSPEIPPQADVLRLGMVFGLNEENPQLSWKTFTENIEVLTAPNPGDRPNVLAKRAPAIYWNSVPPEQMSSWLKAHLDDGMTQMLADNMAHARFKLDEKNRLLQAANGIASSSKQ
ncbi:MULTISPECIES: M1 family metallopeptidase [unclassified Janthinobacterium]|uniref:M1 family metallopeptidase n=1 Tax=unclassified Janthinobacterium TaxID=2610881 RepID=UPI00161DFD25|nr:MULTISPECIES: M1 family metallopeptidase [unclassified Janthinobacterium]MBB5370464.1 aminopeptidase N [Janthinobacterium sp. K2C7]MBB5383322.1 aminopeptidase N [Janthinobacterium sp. K2Li3]MBB5388776.1 aminopeptidase N [Janthinobacterium sp. K2E3]